MDAIPPTIPFSVAKAYGVKAPAKTVTVQPVGPGTTPVSKPGTNPVAKALIAPQVDAATLTTKTLTKKIASLVAAKVDAPAVATPVKPITAAPVTSATDALAFYRRPTDAVDVATEIAVGRSLDTQG
ncbi:MAG: hypothetical protein AAGI53_06860 [Planctomycetota bacterium]